MVWTKAQLDDFQQMRKYYIQWAAEIEAGKPGVTTKVLGVLVDDHSEALARYRRNADELERILKESGAPLDA